MKKLLALFLSLLMVLFLLAGCGGGGDQETQAPPKETGGDVESTGGDQPGEKITMTIGLPQNIKVEDYDNNAFTNWLEEATGYNLEFVTFASSSTDYRSQLATRLNDLPDILWGFNLTDAITRSYGEDGYFIDLTKYYEDKEKSAIFWERMAELPQDYQEYILQRLTDKETGEMYSVPRVEYTVIDTMDFMPFINQIWLDNLNLKMPTNPEELREVLMAFKTQDANGNGDPSDELPLVAFESGYCGDVVNWIVNMFIYANDNVWWNVDDNGQLYSPFTTDAYREALIYINGLVKDGLMFDTAWAGDHKDLKPLLNLEGGLSRVGVWLAHPTSVLQVEDPCVYDYEAIPIWGNAVRKQNAYNRRCFITEACANPDAAWNLLMTMCSKEGSLRMRYGEKGVDWVEADPGTTSFLGYDAEIKILNEGAFTSLGNQTWGANDATILVYAENEVCQFTEGEDPWLTQKNKIVKGCYDYYVEAEKSNPKKLMQPLFYSVAESEETEVERTNCQAKIKEARSQFGSGVMDPTNDAQWNAYLNELNSMGLETWRTQNQRMFEEQQG